MYEKITLRDQFALNAPPVPNWFRPELKSYYYAHDFRGPDPHGQADALNMAVEHHNEMVGLIQWPYAYADLMLAERARSLNEDAEDKEVD